MNFTIDRDVFLENLNIISRGIPSKTSLPILYGIKIEVTNSDIYLSSSNMDISIQVMISDKSLEIDEPGKLVVTGKFFIDIIRKVNSKKITVYTLDDKQILIKVDRGEFKLHIMDYDDYPNLSFLSLENPLTLNISDIKSIIKETGFATATNEKRPIFTGVNFNLKDNNLVCVGTDSYRLAQKKLSLNNNYNDFNITIPSKSLDELLKILESPSETVDVYFSTNKVLFKYNKVLFQSRLLDGKFPDTSKVIPVNSNFTVKFNRDELIDSLDRVSLICPADREKNREVYFSAISLTIEKDKKIQIKSNNSQVGEANEELIANEVDNNGEKLEIGFSAQYLLQALHAIDAIEVTIEFTEARKPFIVYGDVKEDLVQVILPVTL